MKRLLYVYPSPDATNRLAGAVPEIVVVDLEEAVAPHGKAKARGILGAAIEALRPIGAQLLVRVNGVGGEDMALDLAEVVRLPVDVGVLLPKPLDLALVPRQHQWHRFEVVI